MLTYTSSNSVSEQASTRQTITNTILAYFNKITVTFFEITMRLLQHTQYLSITEPSTSRHRPTRHM